LRVGTLAGAIALAGLLAFLAPIACEQKAAPAKAVAKRPADKVYTVRGQILMLPVPGKPTTDLVIHHEAIDDFVNPGGKLGMASMEMPMPAGPGVSLKEFAVGDIVELDLSVWYKPEFTAVENYSVTRLKKLPADTALKFGEAAPPLAPTKASH
jgi:hypothetical protein